MKRWAITMRRHVFDDPIQVDAPLSLSDDLFEIDGSLRFGSGDGKLNFSCSRVEYYNSPVAAMGYTRFHGAVVVGPRSLDPREIVSEMIEQMIAFSLRTEENE